MQLVFDSCPDLRDHFQIIYDLLDKTVVQDGQKTIRTQWACNGRCGWICTRYRMVVWYAVAKRIEFYAFRIRLLKVRSHLLPLLPLLIFKLLGKITNLLLISGAQRSAVSKVFYGPTKHSQDPGDTPKLLDLIDSHWIHLKKRGNIVPSTSFTGSP